MQIPVTHAWLHPHNISEEYCSFMRREVPDTLQKNSPVSVGNVSLNVIHPTAFCLASTNYDPPGIPKLRATVNRQ